ncbi:MAG: NAD(P)(+) transhydrogenase (Re/Si-specific) subunit beta [Spirochaetaceae bacterium]
MTFDFVNLAYLVAAVLFILGLKGLTHPRSAVRGNVLGAVAMLIAVVVTLVDQQVLNTTVLISGIAGGTVIGAVLALTIKMTAMPQLVGLFNGFGGGASVLVAAVALMQAVGIISGAGATELSMQVSIATVLSAIIGAVTFTGSVVAFAKLQGLVTEQPVRYKGEQIVKLLVAGATVAGAIMVIMNPADMSLFWVLSAVAGLLGLLLVVPIGGADMPIVIALLNSYSGLAAAATGFVLSNTILIVSGSLVGASGIILTRIMCKAMNRSLANVLFGGMGAIPEKASTDDIYDGKIKSTNAEEVAMILKTARRVVFVPGYGMAVARAQSAVRQLAEAMEADEITVEFGIHPVAGRMPGHMNVLLAEEAISYDKLKEMDQINPTFKNTDVTIVIGANDVVNPSAREAGGPISGMPILDVDKSRTVVVIKRSLSPGFAGIANPLFALDNTLMYFGDGKKALDDLVQAYKEA